MRFKLPPALKHGAYTTMSVLPGESRSGFNKLHRELIAELAPSGVLEEEVVVQIAHLLWRKKNLGTLRLAELAQHRHEEIRSEKEEKLDLMTFGSESVAARTEYRQEQQKARRNAEVQARSELGEVYTLVEINVATFDNLTSELDMDERIDALIDKCLKRLLMVKGLKSISCPSISAPHALAKASTSSSTPRST
jgi:hypothetical protein